MKCPSCDKTVDADWLFCLNCGAALDGTPSTSAETADDKFLKELQAGIVADIAVYREHKGTDDDIDVLIRSTDAARCEEWLRAARGGCPEAQWLASRCHRMGHVFPENAREANWLCDLAARHGEPLALYDRACRYEAGVDVEPDLAQAAALYYRVAVTGVARAQCRLAECCLRSGAGEWELGEAAKWLRAAASQGSMAAEDRLAQLYIAEGSMAMPCAEGADWLIRSAN